MSRWAVLAGVTLALSLGLCPTPLAAYGHPELDRLGAEQDEVFDRILRQALAAR